MAKKTATATAAAKTNNRIKDAAQKAAPTMSAIEIPPLRLGDLRLRIRGTNLLCVHAWSSKAKKMMLSKQMKEASGPREAKSPIEDFLGALYWLEGEKPQFETDPKTGQVTYSQAVVQEAIKTAKFGVRALSLKNAMVGACRFIEGITMTQANGAVFVYGAEDPGEVLWNPKEMLLIKGSHPIMREDIVRLQGQGRPPDIRYRPEFTEWHIDILIRYNAGFFSAAQVVNLLATAGFSQGICENRPERGGDWGTFEIEETY